MAKTLTDDQINNAISSLDGWSYDDGKLNREFKFADFSEAFAFMTRCAMFAEKIDHHPNWENVWNTVSVELVTHDAGGVTQNDIDFAKKMNELASS